MGRWMGINTAQKHLLEAEEDLRLGLRFSFKENNSPKHTARITMEYKQVNGLVKVYNSNLVSLET